MSAAAAPTKEAPSDHTSVADADGRFRRQESSFRSYISCEPGARFPPEKDRYVLYINLGCPWAARANAVRTLKGLDSLIQLVVMSYELTPEGWIYTGYPGTASCDPLYGFTKHRDLYFKADPDYKGRYTVPVLWDRKEETIVNNESSEIIRMFYSAFDGLLSEKFRESARPGGGMLPAHLKGEIEAFNEWVYHDINNGVYKTGFATAQDAYEENLEVLFQALGKVERHLADGRRFLFGDHVTDADVRLFTTVVRFDAAYYTLFRCNLGMIRTDFPNMHGWLRRVYWDDTEETRGAFRTTTDFDHIKRGYARASKSPVVPKGPVPDILPLDG
ncbi:Glutathione S-transferase omega-like 2 [Sphaceloma murrayae]|uniref:Glutathione S-transferase omega-like 2 n=1 Tax=Sphaceloma murrayae TaxID=2082308 RepID=A0A2K1R2J3_9PEZI|nr:Glutathione S-transferase omega-like 2 [Sphaceloma murrayae]